MDIKELEDHYPLNSSSKSKTQIRKMAHNYTPLESLRKSAWRIQSDMRQTMKYKNGLMICCFLTLRNPSSWNMESLIQMTVSFIWLIETLFLAIKRHVKSSYFR